MSCGGAVMSGPYRYLLWRCWDDAPTLSLVTFVMLNPSTADDTQDDPTVRRCVAYAKAWGHAAVRVVNLFALRATDPATLRVHPDPVGPENDFYIAKAVRDAAVAVCAWGAHGTLHGRGEAVEALIPRPTALALTRDGTPRHPLYLPGRLRPVPLRRLREDQVRLFASTHR